MWSWDLALSPYFWPPCTAPRKEKKKRKVGGRGNGGRNSVLYSQFLSSGISRSLRGEVRKKEGRRKKEKKEGKEASQSS